MVTSAVASGQFARREFSVFAFAVLRSIAGTTDRRVITELREK